MELEQTKNKNPQDFVFFILNTTQEGLAASAAIPGLTARRFSLFHSDTDPRGARQLVGNSLLQMPESRRNSLLYLFFTVLACF
jgi:hypothetical protein